MDDVTLTKVVCRILGRIPGWSWRETGPAYTDDEVAIFYGPLKPDPDRAVGVRVYDGTDTAHLATRRVQLRFRGRPGELDGADRLAFPAFVLLDGLSRTGGISGARRMSLAPLGADTNGREERTDNYEITLDNLEASS